jgi:hypothetical protein
MKKSVALTLLLLLTPLVIFSHIDWVETDNGVLFSVDGREVDAYGALQDRWRSLRYNCKHTTALDSSDAKHAQVKQLIQSYSPPDSHFVKNMVVWARDDWFLAEVEFETLLPAVVVIQKTAQGLRIVPNAVWSGLTKPWVAGPHIRRYLSKQVPEIAPALLNCFELRTTSFL